MSSRSCVESPWPAMDPQKGGDDAGADEDGDIAAVLAAVGEPFRCCTKKRRSAPFLDLKIYRTRWRIEKDSPHPAPATFKFAHQSAVKSIH